MSNLPTEGIAEQYILIAGGDGYTSMVVDGREAMERAFLALHWDPMDFNDLTDEQRELLAVVRDENEWNTDALHGRIAFDVQHEDGWVRIYRLVNPLPGFAPEPRDDEAAGQVEHLDRANHRLTRCLQAVMADLVDLLDADQFNNIEARVLSAGVPYPPLGTDPRLSTTPAAKYVEGGKCPTCGHCGNCDGHGIVSGTNANSEVFSDCPVCRPLTKPASRDRTPATARCECRTCCNTFMGAPGDFNCATCLPGNGGEK